MKVKLLMLTALILTCPVFGQIGSIKRVAILETVDKEGKVPYGVKLMVRSKLIGAINNTPGYKSYERVDVASIMDEHEFQRTGLVSDTQIKQLGEMSGAEYILINEIAQLDRSSIYLVSKIINIETLKVEKISRLKTTANLEDIGKTCSKVASELLSVDMDFTETTAGLNLKMVYVEGGEFQMGATSEQKSYSNILSDGQIIRLTKLDSYFIGECEITQEQWFKVMGSSVEQQVQKYGKWLDSTGSNYPMYCISWVEAHAFCLKLSQMTGKTYSLPTEAQWEYAARGGQKSRKTVFSGGWLIDNIGWSTPNSGGCIHPVKQKLPNELNLYDMSGNVSEWCLDWYEDSYNYKDTNNPKGPKFGSKHVVRGGSRSSNPNECRVSFRHTSREDANNEIGFRVVVLP